MSKIKYAFDDGISAELEVDDELYLVHLLLEKKTTLSDRKETRRHQSLDRLIELGRCFADPNTDIQLEVERAETETELHKALKCLTEKQSYILFSHILDSLSFREIARQLGCNKDTVREHYYSAIKKLKNILS